MFRRRRRPKRPYDPARRMAQWAAVFFFGLAIALPATFASIRLYDDGWQDLSFEQPRRRTPPTILERPPVDIEEYRLYTPPEPGTQWTHRVAFALEDPSIADIAILPAEDWASSPTLAVLLPDRLVLAHPGGLTREADLPQDIVWALKPQLAPLRIEGEVHVVALATNPSRAVCLDLRGNVVWEAPAPRTSPLLSVRATRDGDNVVFVHCDDGNSPTHLECFDAHGNKIFGLAELQPANEHLQQSQLWSELKGGQSGVAPGMAWGWGQNYQFSFIWSPLPEESWEDETVLMGRYGQALFLRRIESTPIVATEQSPYGGGPFDPMLGMDPSMMFFDPEQLRMYAAADDDATTPTADWKILFQPFMHTAMLLKEPSEPTPRVPAIAAPDPERAQWLYFHHGGGVASPAHTRSFPSIDFAILDEQGAPLGALLSRSPRSAQQYWMDFHFGRVRPFLLLPVANLLYYRGNWWPLDERGGGPGFAEESTLAEFRFFLLPESFLIAARTTNPHAVTLFVMESRPIAANIGDGGEPR